MTDEEIIRLSKLADETRGGSILGFFRQFSELCRLEGYAQGLADRGQTPCEEISVANAILNERELCAQACEELNNNPLIGCEQAYNECAAAIRARSA